MSIKIEIEWFLSSEKLHPDKPGLSSYEQIPCLVVHAKHGEKNLLWNCEHLCWDREDGDDHYCDPEHVVAWAITPNSPYNRKGEVIS